MAKKTWDASDISDQTGRGVIVTGSTSGIGKEAARVLAGKGAEVTLAVRNIEKGKKVAEEFTREFPGAKVDVRPLDLTSLDSVRSFAEQYTNDHDSLDILINNAGIMMCPFAKTADGFEIQMGTNHLGHFALTGLLLPLLTKTSGSRIVNISSGAHNFGNIDFDDLNWENRSYNTQRAYGDSKLANLYFTFELARKLKAHGDTPKVTAAHPGWTATELQRHAGLFERLNFLFAQKVDRGTLPTLRAATDDTAQPGDYFGPNGFMEFRGDPVKVDSSARSKEQLKAERLWTLSEELTGVTFSI